MLSAKLRAMETIRQMERKLRTIQLLILVLLSACSAARQETVEPQGYSGENSANEGYGGVEATLSANDSAPMAAPPRPMAMPSVEASAKRSYDFTAKAASAGGSVGHAQKTAQYVPTQPPQQNYQQNTHVTDQKVAPSIIYQGYMRLRVRRTLEAIEAATKLAVDGGGYVQMQTAQALIVRMPATDFDAAMLKFAELGEVLQRTVQAVDVTRQVTDLDARMGIAVQSRARLLELLKTVKDVEERLQILEEIKRLTELIETMQSSLATLRNLTNFFTITIDFEALVNGNAVISHASPFEWIRGLQAHRVTLDRGRGSVKMALPAGFVLFDDRGAWRAQASDTSMLRAAKVDNDPKGDALFWAKAVEFELDGRDEALVDSSKRGLLEVRVFKNKDPRPRWWLVATTTVGDDAWVVEAFFPDETAYKAHITAVLSALTTFGVD